MDVVVKDTTSESRVLGIVHSKLLHLATTIRFYGHSDLSDEILDLCRKVAAPLTNTDKDTINRLIHTSLERVKNYFDSEGTLKMSLGRSKSSEDEPFTFYLTVSIPKSKEPYKFEIRPHKAAGEGGYPMVQILLGNKNLDDVILDRESKETLAASPSLLKSITKYMFELAAPTKKQEDEDKE
jgi:hypothetical protein